jgi:hypothetical protein
MPSSQAFTLRALPPIQLPAQCDWTLQALAVETFNVVLAKYGHRRIVRNPRMDD